MKDLFETPFETWPETLQAIFNRYELANDLSYSELAEMLTETESIGYTFDYYLDADPYGLRPIGTPLEALEGWENI